MLNSNSPSPSLQALGTCYSNATRCLEIIVKEFARVQMLVRHVIFSSHSSRTYSPILTAI